jgi:hypothetical protein
MVRKTIGVVRSWGLEAAVGMARTADELAALDTAIELLRGR